MESSISSAHIFIHLYLRNHSPDEKNYWYLSLMIYRAIMFYLYFCIFYFSSETSCSNKKSYISSAHIFIHLYLRNPLSDETNYWYLSLTVLRVIIFYLYFCIFYFYSETLCSYKAEIISEKKVMYFLKYTR